MRALVTLYSTHWRTRCRRGYGHVIREAAWWWWLWWWRRQS